MQVSYNGPTTFVATDDDPKSLQVTLQPTSTLPAGTEIAIALGGSFRSVTTEWELPDVSCSAGGLEVTQEPPTTFEEVYRSHIPDSYRNPPKQYRLVVLRVTEAMAAGTSIAVALRGTLSPHVGVDPTLSAWLKPVTADRFKRVGTAIPLENRPGDPARLAVRARPEAGPDGSHRAVIFATDSCQNPVQSYTATIDLDVAGDGDIDGVPADITIPPDSDGRYRIEELRISGGPVRIRARDPTLELEARSPALFEGPVADWNQYFGGIHFHTEVSHDGDRHVRDAYAHARDYLQLDVVAVTDHTPGTAAWTETVAINETFNDPGSFVTIPAWEWSAVDGHANIYLRSSDVDAGPGRADPMEIPSYGHFDVEFGDDPTVHPAEVDWPDGAILVPHHTSAGGSKYWKWWDWAKENDRIQSVEIVQGRGNFEADEVDEDWDIRYEDRGASVQDALERGYRLGFVAGTDNHHGFPTVRAETGPTGLTCFLAEDRTRDAIWRAMEERRTYATSGVPIRCHYAVNGHRLGSEAIHDGSGVTFAASLYGTAPIERVEIISDRETVWSATPEQRDVRFQGESLPAPTGSTYYYLRLRQTDGHRAWLSPVWLDRE